MSKPEISKCPKCKTDIKITASYCKSCGTKIEKEPKNLQCNDCGDINDLDAKFCENCGSQNLSPEATKEDMCFFLSD
ncbi:MAG: hypothetical protein HPY60_11485 [Candidatus Methanofastidiosum sp.]|nr:hypothetical protein [Methanofastidiosum sp.]